MLSIPEIASQLVDKTFLQVDEDNARTLFLVGSKSAGKSTLLNSFLDKTDTPRETLVLEYSFGRKSNQKQGIEKMICHIWEYGGKLTALRNVLPSIPVNGKYYFCVMVDLSKIKRIWDTIETCLQNMKDNYPESEKLPEVMIVGGKYDIFKTYVPRSPLLNTSVFNLLAKIINDYYSLCDLKIPQGLQQTLKFQSFIFNSTYIYTVWIDSEIKKFICTTIRSLALIYDTNVLFYSSKDAPLARRTKETLQNMGFGNGIVFKEKNTNFTKPLAIPRGSDSWESIGTSPVTLDQLKMKHLTRIPPETLSTEVTINTSAQKAAHPEPTLDMLAAFKYEELRNVESLDISIDDYLFGVNK